MILSNPYPARYQGSITGPWGVSPHVYKAASWGTLSPSSIHFVVALNSITSPYLSAIISPPQYQAIRWVCRFCDRAVTLRYQLLDTNTKADVQEKVQRLYKYIYIISANDEYSHPIFIDFKS